MADRELFALIAGGDEKAFEAFYRRHLGWVLNFLKRLTGNAADAEDLAQDVFAKVPRMAQIHRHVAAPKTALHTTVVRVFFDFLRGKKSRREKLEGYAAAVALGADGASDPVARVDLAAAFDDLPAVYGEALLMRACGWSEAEIAAATATTKHTARSRAHRARVLARAYLNRPSGLTAADGLFYLCIKHYLCDRTVSVMLWLLWLIQVSVAPVNSLTNFSMAMMPGGMNGEASFLI